MNYTFTDIPTCVMCGAGRDQHRVVGLRLNRSQGRSPRKAAGIAVSVKQCGSCGLLFSDPQPRPADLSDHYGVPAENYWKPQYFEHNPAYFAKEIAIAKRLIGFRPGMKALDIGAGAGKAMASLEKAGFDVYGIEPSGPFRDKAVQMMGISPDRLQLSALEDAQFEDGSFDFITFGAVLEHLYEPAASIERAMRWLRPGGVMQIEVPSADWLLSKLLNAYFRLRGVNYVTNISPMHAPFHMHEFTLRSFQRHASHAGYDVAHHEYYVCSLPHIPGVLHRPLRWWMERTDTGMQLCVWLRPAPAAGRDAMGGGSLGGEPKHLDPALGREL